MQLTLATLARPLVVRVMFLKESIDKIVASSKSIGFYYIYMVKETWMDLTGLIKTISGRCKGR